MYGKNRKIINELMHAAKSIDYLRQSTCYNFRNSDDKFRNEFLRKITFAGNIIAVDAQSSE